MGPAAQRRRDTNPPATAWWGTFEVPIGDAARWRIGPLELAASRRPGEWRLAAARSGDPQDERTERTVGRIGSFDEPADQVVRFAISGDETVLRLAPATADRPVVARPDVPFHLLPGERVALFVNTPAWVRVLLPDPPRLLLDLPTLRPSDSWFGSSTREGELCYANRTSARLAFANLPHLPHRVITRVELSNAAADAFPLERLSLPVPSLSLFADGAGQLWTESVAVERQAGTTDVAVRLGSRPPAEAVDAELLDGPRTPPEKGVLVRAFSALFG